MEETNNELHVGDIVTGTVVKIDDKQVFVDVGQKSEGIIPISELSNLHVENPAEIVSEGDELTLEVKKMEDEEIILSKKLVDAEKAWEELQSKYDAGEVFETEVKEVVKGGLVVEVGRRGVMPASLVETYFVGDDSEYRNKTLKAKIDELESDQKQLT